MTLQKSAGAHDARCGATTRGGSPCRFVAGYKTDHVGQGRCHLHGGKNPVKHGRYSAITRERIRNLIETHAADADPLNVLPELAAARALFQDFVERYDETTAALLAWHRSWVGGQVPLSEDKAISLVAILDEFEAMTDGGDGLTEIQRGHLATAREAVDALTKAPTGKPATVLDLSDAYRIVSEITKIVERIERVRAANAVSRGDFLRVLTEMGRVVELCNDEPDPARRLQRIKDGWLGLRLG